MTPDDREVLGDYLLERELDPAALPQHVWEAHGLDPILSGLVGPEMDWDEFVEWVGREAGLSQEGRNWVLDNSVPFSNAYWVCEDLFPIPRKNLAFLEAAIADRRRTHDELVAVMTRDFEQTMNDKFSLLEHPSVFRGATLTHTWVDEPAWTVNVHEQQFADLADFTPPTDAEIADALASRYTWPEPRKRRGK